MDDDIFIEELDFINLEKDILNLVLLFLNVIIVKK